MKSREDILNNFCVKFGKPKGCPEIHEYMALCDKHRIKVGNHDGTAQYYGVRNMYSSMDYKPWGKVFSSVQEFKEFLEGDDTKYNKVSINGIGIGDTVLVVSGGGNYSRFGDTDVVTAHASMALGMTNSELEQLTFQVLDINGTELLGCVNGTYIAYCDSDVKLVSSDAGFWKRDKSNVIIHRFKGKDIYKNKGMKIGTFGIRNCKKMKIKKEWIENLEI